MDKDIIRDIRSNCKCGTIDYCPFEELLKHYDSRLYQQHKIVEILKFVESQKIEKDIGWERAYFIWVDEGYAEAFAKIYKPKMTHHQIIVEMEIILNKKILN